MAKKLQKRATIRMAKAAAKVLERKGWEVYQSVNSPHERRITTDALRDALDAALAVKEHESEQSKGTDPATET